MMVRTLAAAIAVAAGVSAVVAQSDPLTQRQALMKSSNDAMRDFNRMSRGEQPFDLARVNAIFATLTEQAEKAPSLFPSPPPPDVRTRAQPRIWETKADFDAKFVAFGKAVADNKAKAQTPDGVRAAFTAVNDGCNNCHELYRGPSGGGGKKK